MKKILFLVVCVAMFSSCDELRQNEKLKSQNESLSVALAERDAE